MKKKITEKDYETYHYIRPQAFALYRKIFNMHKPLPLCVGVHEMLLADPANNWTSEEISSFLKVWTVRREYFISLAHHGKRFNLEGEAVYDFTYEEMKNAARGVAAMAKRMIHKKVKERNVSGS